uniref:NADH-ubiquinone oxidoreductase chain 4L n=1 Tax=Xerotyphlops vermicularis TaxID=759976 RepID=A0A5C2A5U8_9SAUR|nr:NADH dehydrogenase subunit 4L [Xerotyphlops vermicularis]QEO33844.1 NADH dehydrogenase subunit 4L [Xerotyphlops vermicularis]
MSPIQEALLTAFSLTALSLSTQQKHFMYALLCIEAMMLSLFVLMTVNFINLTHTTGLPAPIMMLTMAACGAAVGLSLMIATIRTHGNDLLNNLNLL